MVQFILKPLNLFLSGLLYLVITFFHLAESTCQYQLLLFISAAFICF